MVEKIKQLNDPRKMGIKYNVKKSIILNIFLTFNLNKIEIFFLFLSF